MKNFGEKGAWAYPVTAQFFRVPPIISGTGKATDFKFSQYIQGIHPNKIPWKILEKRKRGRIQRLPKFFGYPLLSQEQEKLQISNLASTSRGSIRIKAHEKFWKKGSVGVSRDCPIFSGTPYYLRNGESYGFQLLHAHLWAQSEQKPIKNSGKVAVGVVRDSWKFSGRPNIGHIAWSSLR